LSRVRTSGESPDSAQAGRGPQWPIHRKRQMTVTDGRESAILSFPLQPLRPHNARTRARARGTGRISAIETDHLEASRTQGLRSQQNIGLKWDRSAVTPRTERHAGVRFGVRLGHSAMSAQCPRCPKADVDGCTMAVKSGGSIKGHCPTCGERRNARVRPTMRIHGTMRKQISGGKATIAY
jgi:hypothetical protein